MKFLVIRKPRVGALVQPTSQTIRAQKESCSPLSNVARLTAPTRSLTVAVVASQTPTRQKT